MSETDELLDSLVGDLKPVASPRLLLSGGLWFLLSLVYVMAIAGLLGPLRSGAFEQIASHPRFLGEMLLGLVGAGCFVALACQSAVPGRPERRLGWVASMAGFLWVGNFVVGLVAPALEPSMLGKRPHCYAETVIYALPPLFVLLYWQRRMFPLRPQLSAALAGLAAGILPAWYMQIACMYDPAHILRLHVLPGLLVVGLAVLVVKLLPGRLSGSS